ncbi:gliding motility-associated ABC transporter ATP-binding subunit GldA [Lutimonas zeaxanthinifaciens]|uniref:gliding motility-associated ABC transporter ATP-binding subunit GldA n=1 Tax=Lutimonas zeaxanthinifaciens TaxID=3060215 RepID=UPI00265CFFD4|nr:gliding motility-associated ABC transporter ATP-binding subunit GldA [Lutimonas sp. YSD2104]WKK66096.1 gliding motility-associated ABC transporter ATP-binding subunit GldA [Lutimonas sp. YSD2104]
MSIEVDSVVKQYGAQKALNSVSFKIKTGEIVGFLGPNGAGKSTMMKIITTYVEPSKGSVFVNGFSTENQGLHVKKSVGYLPEHNPLYLDFYVKEYLKFHADIHGVGKERIKEVIDQVGLIDIKGKKIGQLSKGYRQRVGLAAALLHDPEVLILDEPTTGLDPNQLRDIRDLIKKIGKSKTILLSTHIMQEVEAMCDRVIIINKGNIVADEKLDDLLTGQFQTIQIEFDKKVDEEIIKKLPYLKQISNLEGNVWSLGFETEEDMRAKVFDFTVHNGFRALQLNQRVTSLEALFQNLTN